jgi:hypothetical protein
MPIFRPFFGKFVSELQAVTDRRDKYIRQWVSTPTLSAPRNIQRATRNMQRSPTGEIHGGPAVGEHPSYTANIASRAHGPP